MKNRKFKTSYLGFFLLLFFAFSFPFTPSLHAQKQDYVVVLDAGHGGKDPGNVGNGYREKDIALKVVLELGKILAKENYINVKYTRKTDVNVDLWERGNIANQYKADLFVSIHCNSHNTSAYGTESFVLGMGAMNRNFKVAKDFVKKENAVILNEKNYKEKYKGFDENSAESVIELSLIQEENLDKSLVLANSIQSDFRSGLKRKDRGVKQAKFVVLYQTYMPSVLVELGFLTNKKEGKYLNSKKGQQELAKSIAKAVKKYIDQLRMNTVSSDDVLVVDIPDTKDDIDVQDDTVKEEDNVLFKIQIASSKKKIRTKSYNFKGLKNVERVKVGKFYKYYYGHSTDYQETKKAFEKAKKKGYSSAFIVAFKNGEKVPLAKALK